MTGTSTALHALDQGAPSDDLDAYQHRLNELDSQILELLWQRASLAREIGAARVQNGLPRRSHDQDLLVFRRYALLGSVGTDLAALLLRLERAEAGR